MIVAAAQGDEERRLLLVGLSETNLRRLRAGEPIVLHAGTHGGAVPAGLTVILCAGETEGALVAQLEAIVGPETRLTSVAAMPKATM